MWQQSKFRGPRNHSVSFMKSPNMTEDPTQEPRRQIYLRRTSYFRKKSLYLLPMKIFIFIGLPTDLRAYHTKMSEMCVSLVLSLFHRHPPDTPGMIFNELSGHHVGQPHWQKKLTVYDKSWSDIPSLLHSITTTESGNLFLRCAERHTQGLCRDQCS